MQYLRYTFAVNSDTKDLWLAQVAQLPFDTFDDNSDEELHAWCAWNPENQVIIEQGLHELQQKGLEVLECMEEPQVNWNQVWESNYEPVCLGDRLRIRAPFHSPDPGFGMELVIEPHMSFGTGHHPTTVGILRRMMEQEWNGKSVLDMGAGTGILAIYARKCGADPVVAIDHEEWAAINARENARRNGVELISLQGSFESIAGMFDVVLANINQNIILGGLEKIVGHLNPGGILLSSGYYPDGHIRIAKEAAKLGLREDAYHTEGDWAVSRFHKPI